MTLIEEPKIFSTSFLMGGLGNQMFQISHAICQGWKNNVPSIFKCVSYTPMQANQPTKYVDNIFRNITFFNYESQPIRISTPWQFVDLKPEWKTPIEFYGYFQSGKNFYGFEEKISELFQPTEEFVDKIYKKFPSLNKEKTVSIHIRRGDYLTINTILPTIDKTYIDECLIQIGNYDQIFIFSDDVNWAKENLKYDNTIFVDDLEDYEDLWLISLCKINVMSNSSFSWWGTFLNKNIDKKVFAPSVWFGPSGEQNYSDIYEKNWTIINTEYSEGVIKFFI
jgi:hypothetical protein